MSDGYTNMPEGEDIPDIEESSLIGAADTDQENKDTPIFKEKEDISSMPDLEASKTPPASGVDIASIAATAASQAVSAALSVMQPPKDESVNLQALLNKVDELKKELSDMREELNSSKADLESIKKSTLYEKENDDSAANIINTFLLQLREAPKYLSEIHEERKKREIQSQEISAQLEKLQNISSSVDGIIQIYSDASNIIQLTQDANQVAAMAKIEKTSQGMLKKIKGLLGK